MSRVESDKAYSIKEPLPGIEGFCHTAARFFCKEGETRGIENVQEVRELSDSGHPIVFVGNHRSNADAAAFYKGLSSAGFEDLAKRIKYILGQRLKFDWKTKYFTRGYAHIDVVPPTMNSGEIGDRATIVAMNRAAEEHSREVLSNNGILVLFPEGTRTRDGKMHDFIPGAMKFTLLCDSTYIAPFALAKTENVWPVGSSAWHRCEVDINFGRAFRVDDVVDGIKSQSEKRIALAERAQLEVIKLSPISYIPSEMQMRFNQGNAMIGK